MNTSITTLDIISSAFNEEECIEELYSRINSIMADETSYRWRLILFDNGSTDNTWSLISTLAKKDSRVLGLRMSRNFSLDAALTSGIDIAEAEIAILMTSDLQDPPEAIPLLLRKYEEGFEQVLVKITKRGDVPWPRRLMSTLFYRSANWMTDGMLPELVSDFRLLGRNVYVAISKMRESHRFLRGLGAWVGFRTTFIELERPPRFAGESKWLKSSLFTVILHATKSIFSHSSKPLVWISSLGLVLSLGSLITILGMSIVWLLGTVPFAGFGTIVGLISLGFSLTMLCIGVLAQYLALIYEEVKQRPLYIVAEKTY